VTYIYMLLVFFYPLPETIMFAPEKWMLGIRGVIEFPAPQTSRTRPHETVGSMAPTGNYKKLALHTIQPLGPDFMMLFPEEDCEMILMILMF